MRRITAASRVAARHRRAPETRLWRRRSIETLIAAIVLPLVLLLAGCSSLPANVEREASAAFSQPLNTHLGKQFAPIADRHPGESGFQLLSTGPDALLARLALVDAAEQAIDLQYYIWNSDRSGRLLAAHVLAAAERGVRVRLLLDDFSVAGRDEILAILDSHTNIQIRLYNPFSSRSGLAKWISALGDLRRINRRMHNKALIVDGTIAIAGGRNIGDEYFDLHSTHNFLDRDLLVVGPMVGQLSVAFDDFWNSDVAYPIQALISTPPSSEQASGIFASLSAKTLDQNDRQKLYPGIDDWPPDLTNYLAQKLLWAKAELVYDIPPTQSDIRSPADTPKRVATTLRKLATQANRELLVESAYLVPDQFGLDLLERANEQGIRIRAVTNSLASNDVITNHAGYVRRRRAILKRDGELYEFKPNANICSGLYLPTLCSEEKKIGLHAKSIVLDRAIVYIGSFNINLRSTYLNTETALIIHSPRLAEMVASEIELLMQPENSWRVKLHRSGQLEWGDGNTTYRHEPETSWWRRFKSGFFSLFPLEKYY